MIVRKPIVKMLILKEDLGYSAYVHVGINSIFTQGDTFEELNEMIIDAVNLTFEEEGFIYTIDEIKMEYDLKSFFSFYKVINAKTLSRRIRMNQALLTQYIKGIKKPSPAQTKKILNGVQQLGRELTEIPIMI